MTLLHSNPAVRPDDGRVLRGRARRLARKSAALILASVDVSAGSRLVDQGPARVAYEREWARLLTRLSKGGTP